MKITELLTPLGIAAYTAVTITFLTGLLKFKFHARWIDFKWHFRAGILAIILASLHLAVVIYSNF